MRMEVGEKRNNGENNMEADESHSITSPPHAKKKATWSDKIMDLVKSLNSFYDGE